MSSAPHKTDSYRPSKSHPQKETHQEDRDDDEKLDHVAPLPQKSRS